MLDLSGETTHTILFLLGRILSVFLATATVYLFYRAVRVIEGARAALFSASLLAFSPTFVYYGKTANLDLPYTFWATAALLFLLRSLRGRRLRDFVLFAICGVLSICTKDQVYAFWIATPILLVAALASGEGNSPGVGSLLKSTVDRRILAAVVAAVVVFAAAYKGVFGAPEFWRHLQTISSPAYEEVRNFPATFFGHFQMAWQTVLNLRFMLSGPALAAAAGGLVLVFSNRRRYWTVAALLVPVTTYLVFFIHAVGFNYDRHLFPVATVAAILAGIALSWLHERLGSVAGRAVSVALLVVIFGYSLVRAAATDLVMFGDARYAAETWIRPLEKASIAGLGQTEMLPRNLRTFGPKRFRPETVGEGWLAPGGWHDCRELRFVGAEYLVPAFPEVFESPGINYREFRVFRNRFDYHVSRTGPALTNLDKIRRSVSVYRRTDEECVERKPLFRMLQELRKQPSEATERAVWEAAQSPDGAPSIRLSSHGTRGVGLERGAWIRGVEPAAVIVENSANIPLSERLRVESVAPPEIHPLRVFLRDRDEILTWTMRTPGKIEVKLPEVAPGAIRVFPQWTDKEWRRRQPYPHLAGIRLKPFSDFDSLKNIFQELISLRDEDDTEVRAEFAKRIRDRELPSTDNIAPGVLSAGLYWHHWTRGPWPAALTLINDSDSPRVPRLQWLAKPPDGDRPLTLYLDDGEDRRRLRFRRRLSKMIELASVPPGTERLVIVWTDKWVEGSGPHDPLVGARLVSAEMASP